MYRPTPRLQPRAARQVPDVQQIGGFLDGNEFRAVGEKPPRQLGLCRQTLVDRAASGAGPVRDFASWLSSPAAFFGWGDARPTCLLVLFTIFSTALRLPLRRRAC
jgi:hypothetical protein